MGNIQEYNYIDTKERKFIYFNIFLSYLTIGIIFSELFYTLSYYFYYFPLLKFIIFIIISGLFLGNLAGNIFFKIIKKHRVIYIITELFYILLVSLFFFHKMILDFQIGILSDNLFFIIPIFIFFTSFFLGIKTSYFLKISSGDFIDDKQGVIYFFINLIFGLYMGVSTPFLIFYKIGVDFNNILPYLIIILILILPSLFKIKLPFNPKTIYAKHFGEIESENNEIDRYRKNFIFAYTIFVSVIIYTTLAYESIVKFSGDFCSTKADFLIYVFPFIFLGFIIGNFLTKYILSFYIEMIFPLFFTLFLFSLYFFGNNFAFLKSIQLFIPLALLFGFSINYSINHIVNNFNQNKRYKIIFLSIFILPFPILLLVNFITYTNKIYYVFLLCVSIFNILVPLFFLLKSDVKLKNKIIYSFISLLFVPIYVSFHGYFKVKLNSDPFISFNNTGLEKNSDTIFYKNKKIIFKGSSCRKKNLEKSLFPSLIYSFIGEKSLIIDGYKDFHENKIGKFFNNVIIHNPNLLIDTGLYNENIGEIVKNPVLFYFQNNTKYSVITDILNLIDQKKNYYRSSEDYYLLIKKHLKKEGVFIQIFDIYESNADFLSIALRNLNNNFKESIVYQFSNQLVVISSNSKNVLEIDDNKYNIILKIFKENNYINSLFIDEVHFLSYFISNGVEDLLFYLPKAEKYQRLNNQKNKPVKWEADFFKIFTFKNDKFISVINKLEGKIRKKIKSNFKKNLDLIKIIKGLELVGSLDLYEECAEKLIELKKIRKNLKDKRIKNYIDQILKNMKSYYYTTALNYEKNKNWLDAKRVYKLIFVIDKKNFDVVYRLGLLSITLQDINSSFEYFLQAMKLKKNDPKVLYQIGALYFSVGNNDDAIKYLKKSNKYGEKTSQPYLYLGLSYEKNNDFRNAKKYYEMALKIAPNDGKIIEKLNNVEQLILEERSKWRFTPNINSELDAEQGEDIALPINKSAHEWRTPPEKSDEKKK